MPSSIDTASSPVLGGVPAVSSESGESGDLKRLGQRPLIPFGPEFHSILSLVGDGVISSDQDGLIVLFNRAAEEIFGYGRDEVLGQPIDLLIPTRFHERHRRDFELFCSPIVPMRRTMGAGREVMGRRKDGSELAVEATLSRQLIGGQPVMTVVVRDISDRRKAESQRQMVANEVAHRLQNTMAVVNSIVTLTSRSATSVTDFRVALLGRLAALSRTNGSLINGSSAATDLRGLLDAELAPFQGVGKITLNGPDVSLNGEAAVALSLVFHELVTNAAKYGSLSAPNGSLQVDWLVPGAESPTLCLGWRESDGPNVALPSRHGFGTVLISRSLASQGGRSELDFNVSGLTCEISLPLASRQTGTIFSTSTT